MSEQRERPATAWEPPATYLGGHAPGTEAWAAARRGGLGGSEVAAVLGLSPFESRFSLWHRKQGLVGGIEDEPVLEWGRRLEEPVAAKFADEHPEFDVLPGGAWRSLEHPWMVAHPDRLLAPRDGGPVEVLECKIALFDDGWGEPGTDEIPVYYRAQVFHYLDTLGLRRCRLIVLIMGSVDYREYVIDLDDAEQARIRAQCEEFLRTVADDERPNIDDHSETYQVIRELHPDISPETVTLEPETAQRYLDANAAVKAAEAEQRHARSLVADEMGDAHTALHDGRKVAIRMAKDGGAPFVKAHPQRKAPKTTTRPTEGADAA